MKKLLSFIVLAVVVLFLALQVVTFSQGPPQQSVQATIYSNITSSSRLDGCLVGYPCIDNRSQYTRRNSYLAFRAFGTGTWSVDMQYADNSPTVWTSYGVTAQVSNVTPLSGIGFGLGQSSTSKPYHDYTRFVITGSATIQNYFGTSQAWWSTVTNTVSFPITSNQGGTGSGSAFNNISSAADAATWAAAVSTAPAGSTILVDNTFTPAITTGATLASNNVTIQCGPGVLLKTGANSVTALSITGNYATIDGCAFDGRYSQSAYTGTYAIKATAVTGLSIKNNTFTNLSVGGVLVNTSCTDCYFGHNRYTNIGTGIVTDTAGLDVQNPDHTAIEYETFREMTSGNFMHLRAIVSAGGIPHGSVTVDHCWGKNTTPSRLGYEASMFQTGSVKFTNNYSEGQGWPFSLTMQNAGGSPVTTDNELLVEGNSAYWATAGAPAAVGGCFELFSNYIKAIGNTCTGPFFAGFAYSNGGIYQGNHINGAVWGWRPDPSDQTNVSNALDISGNICSNVIIQCIQARTNSSAQGALNISNNTAFRTPVAGDATSGGYAFIGIQMESPTAGVSITDNHSYLLAGTLPGGFAYNCMIWNSFDTGTNPMNITGNTCANLNTTAFGYFFAATGVNEFIGASIYGNTSIGLLAITNPSISAYNTGTVLSYANNVSTIGNVSSGSPPSDFTITSAFKALLSVRGYCSGSVGNGANATSITPFGGQFLLCNGGGATPSIGTIATGLTHIYAMYVSSRTGGADGADGVVTLFDNSSATSVTCTLGTGTACSFTVPQASAFQAGEHMSIRVATDSTNLSDINVVIVYTQQ